MTIYNALIRDSAGNDPARGDHVAIIRTVTNVPSGDSLAKAWLTIKRSLTDADPGILQIIVTPATLLSTVGRITDDGSSDQSGSFQINIQPADYPSIEGGVRYFYDLQVRTAAGIISTLEKGTVKFQPDVTSSDV